MVGLALIWPAMVGLAWLCYCCYGAFLWSTQERIMAYSHGVRT